MPWTVNYPPTHPRPSGSKVNTMSSKGGWGAGSAGQVEQAESLWRDSVYRHTKPVEGRHMWWQTYKSTRMNPEATRQEMRVGLWTFSMCIWSELSLWLYVHQKQESKINFTLQRHWFDSTSSRLAWLEIIPGPYKYCSYQPEQNSSYSLEQLSREE